MKRGVAVAAFCGLVYQSESLVVGPGTGGGGGKGSRVERPTQQQQQQQQGGQQQPGVHRLQSRRLARTTHARRSASTSTSTSTGSRVDDVPLTPARRGEGARTRANRAARVRRRNSSLALTAEAAIGIGASSGLSRLQMTDEIARLAEGMMGLGEEVKEGEPLTAVSQERLGRFAKIIFPNLGSSGRGGDRDDVLRSMRPLPARIGETMLPGPKGFAGQEQRSLDSFPCVAAPSMDNTAEMIALAREEFDDWMSRTIQRNTAGLRYSFDRQQWSNSIRKWLNRLLEADEQARLEFGRLYDRNMADKEAVAMGVVVEDRSEEDWGNIYMSSGADEEGVEQGGMTEGEAATDGYRYVEDLGGEYGFEALMAADEGEAGEFGAEDGGEEIIDCAMRGKWRYRYDDKHVEFTPQGV